MHQSYGGFAGLTEHPPDRLGAGGRAVHVTFAPPSWRSPTIIYVVRGYALRQPDGVLNLQNDFSPADNTKIGLETGWAPRSGRCRPGIRYYNPLGFGRRLFMQART